MSARASPAALEVLVTTVLRVESFLPRRPRLSSSQAITLLLVHGQWTRVGGGRRLALWSGRLRFFALNPDVPSPPISDNKAVAIGLRCAVNSKQRTVSDGKFSVPCSAPRCIHTRTVVVAHSNLHGRAHSQTSYAPRGQRTAYIIVRILWRGGTGLSLAQECPKAFPRNCKLLPGLVDTPRFSVNASYSS